MEQYDLLIKLFWAIVPATYAALIGAVLKLISTVKTVEAHDGRLKAIELSVTNQTDKSELSDEDHVAREYDMEKRVTLIEHTLSRLEANDVLLRKLTEAIVRMEALQEQASRRLELLERQR